MKHVFTFVLAIICVSSVFSQKISTSQTFPPSYKQNLSIEQVDHVRVLPPSQQLIDEEISINEKDGSFLRIAILQPVNLSTKNAGTWETLPNGQIIWRLRLSSEGAKEAGLYFDKFDLPIGAAVYMYSADYKHVVGPYTKADNTEGNEFMIGNIRANDIILEYVAPATKDEKGNVTYFEDTPIIIIGEYAYGFRNENDSSVQALANGAKATGFGSSESCEQNVNCFTWGSLYKRGVAKIIVREGYSTGYCTGTLINNTSHDGTPYFLTANHCGPDATASNFNQWKFIFNYEATGCSSPSYESQINSKEFVGCTKIASGAMNGGSDFYLVKLTNLTTISAKQYNLIYNGWNRSSSTPTQTGAGIHHPSGDIKKISFFRQTPTTASYYGGDDMVGYSNAHWKVKWYQDSQITGVTEAGSSGSPIFNADGLVFGTLSGGTSNCSATSTTRYDLYGKMSFHWDNSSANGSGNDHKLRPWLDPSNTGSTTCSSYDPANSGGENVATSFRYDFESCSSWSVDNFSPCATADGDGLPTYGLSNSDFENEGYTGSFICFESGLANNFDAHGGTKFGVCMAANPGPNNDWFILPPQQISSSTKFSFWARSASDQYGLKTFKVGTSLDDNTYTMSNELEAPVEWTQFVFDLSEYAGQLRYIAIKCSSNDKFAFFIDDIEVSANVETKDFAVLKSLVNIYPNPANKQITVSIPEENASISIINVLGQVVKTISTNEPRTTISIEDLEKGMYIFNIRLSQGTLMKKVVVE